MEIKTELLDFSKFLTPDDFIVLLIIGILSFFGSVGKDYLAMFYYHREMNPIRIILSTITSLLVIFGVSDVILEYTGVKGLMLASFLCGLVGFELLQRLSTIKGLFGILEELIAFKKFMDNTSVNNQEDDNKSSRNRSKKNKYNDTS